MYKMWEHTQGLPDTVSWMAHVQDNDGNTFITGNTIVVGEKANIITTKYNRNGDEIWQVTYNSTYNDNDYGTAITLDDDGNVYVAATSFISATNQYDYRTIKYNSTGTLQWTSTYNGTGSLYDIPSDIIVDASDNVYVTGGSFGSGTGWDYATVKYNSSGTQQWVSRYNYNDNDDAASGLAINNSGRIVVTGGSAQAADNWDFASVKYNQNTGAQLDVQRNTASGLGIDRVYGFTIDGDDNIYLTGRAAISGEGYNMRTVKMDSLLTVQWSKTYDAADGDDVGYAVQVDLAGYVYVTGSITNAEGILNGFTVKYNSAGTVQWSAIETANNGSDLATWNTDLSISEDNEIIIAGTTHNGANSDIIMYIYNSDGEKQWTETWNGTGNGDDTPYFVHADFNNQIYIGGKTFTGTNDAYILVRYKQVNYTTPPDDDTDKPIQLTWFENRGQIIDTEENLRSDIKYYTQRHYPALYASDDSLFMVFSHIDTSTTTDDTLARIDIGYYNSSSTKEIHHATSNGGEYLNYFLAHTGAQGITNVQQHEKLYITELYPKVDMMYYFDNAGIKYYLIIKPGYSAQQNPIQMVINGATKTINADTTLTLTTDIGAITFRTPDAYQIDDDGSRIDLAWDATYTSISDRIGFGLGSYTSSKVLVLEIGVESDFIVSDESDVEWSTLLGGNENDILTDIKTDHLDNIVIGGFTKSNTFPVDLIVINSLIENNDLFIQKFSEEYISLWSLYLGGNGAEPYAEYDEFFSQPSIAINQSNEIIIISSSSSDNYPIENYGSAFIQSTQVCAIGYPCVSDGVISLISPSGTDILWSTYIGGTGIDELHDIELNSNEDIIVVGKSAPNLGLYDMDYFDPVGTDDYFDISKGTGVIYSFNEDGVLLWGTRFGGNVAETILDCIIDNNDNIYITGFTISSEDFPITEDASQVDYGGGGTDAFIAKFNSNYGLEWASYIGGIGTEFGKSIAINESKDLFVGGWVRDLGLGSDLPTFTTYSSVPGSFFIEDFQGNTHDGFLAKYGNEGEGLLLTYFGTDGIDYVSGVFTIGDELFFVGSIAISEFDEDPGTDTPDLTESSAFYFQDEKSAVRTSFISKWDENTVPLILTYIGGTALNQINKIYVADNLFLSVGNATSIGSGSDFYPLKDAGGYYQPTFFEGTEYGRNDGFVFVCVDESITSFVDDYSIMQNTIQLYPNPTMDIVNIISNTESIKSINIYSLYGNLIYKYSINELYNFQLDLTSFASGYYFIEVKTNLNSEPTYLKLLKL